MTTLVTGAFGCIGAWVIRGLLAAGERTVVLDLSDDPWRVRMIAGPEAPSRVVSVRGDVTDREVLGRVVREHGVRRPEGLRPRTAHLARRRRRPDARRVPTPAEGRAARLSRAGVTAYRLRLAAALDADAIMERLL